MKKLFLLLAVIGLLVGGYTYSTSKSISSFFYDEGSELFTAQVRGSENISFPKSSSGKFTCTPTGAVNISTYSCEEGFWIRVGNIVTYGTQINVDPININQNTYFYIDLPEVDNSFSDGTEVAGNCVGSNSIGSANTAWHAGSITSSKTASVNNRSVSHSDGRVLFCTFTYKSK